MKRSLLPMIAVLMLSGCSSYVQRMVLQSFGRIGEPIAPPPRMITTPILKDTKLAVSWVGHATVLIQIRDKIFITDPLFTSTIGMMVKRYVKPGLDPALLSRVDFTLVSHLHFDHFSYGSLDMLPKNGILAIPLGALRYTPDFGFEEIREMKPWDVIEKDGVKVNPGKSVWFTMQVSNLGNGEDVLTPSAYEILLGWNLTFYNREGYQKYELMLDFGSSISILGLLKVPENTRTGRYDVGQHTEGQGAGHKL